METRALLETYLEQGAFEEAVDLVLTHILPVERVGSPRADRAWDMLTQLRYSLAVPEGTVRASPLLLNKSQKGEWK